MDKIKQVVSKDEQETMITMDNGAGLIMVYTNVATVMNRMVESDFNYYSEQTNKKGQVMARQYKLPLSEMAKFLKVKLYK